MMTQKEIEIDLQAVAQAKTYVREESRLIECVLRVESERIFAKLGFSSLYAYCQTRLGLSDSQSSAVSAVTIASAKVPELKAAVRSGELTVSQAKRITKVIKPSNAKEWIHAPPT